jgi:hypothetical protein
LYKEEENREEVTNKLTIVGGQAESKEPPVFKTNIEKVLLKAAKDENFRNSLFTDRKSALNDPEFSLTPQDKLILETIPLPTLTTTLTGIIEKLVQEKMSRRNFFRASAIGLGLVTGAAIRGLPEIENEKVLRCNKYRYEIYSALQSYRDDNNGDYPVSLDDLLKCNSGNKPYLERIPSCPINNTPYNYETEGIGFHLNCKNQYLHNIVTACDDLVECNRYQLTAGIR